MKKTLLLFVMLLISRIAFLQITIDLVPSRTSGKAPLAVYFDASGTSAENIDHPFHKLNYLWNFGDVEENWSTTGKSKNITTGPAAAHVFETAGVYKVNLTVRDINGEIAEQSITITVEDFTDENTIYFSTSGDFAGVPENSTKVTTNDMSTVMSYQETGKRLLLKKGETFSMTEDAVRLGVDGPCMLGAYGSGNSLPRIAATSEDAWAFFDFYNPDWRIKDIEVEGFGTNGTRIVGVRNDLVHHALVMDTKNVASTVASGFILSGSGLSYFNYDLPENLFCVGNTWVDMGFGAGDNIMFVSAAKIAVLGNHFDDNEDGEHIIRLAHGEKAIISNNYLGRQSSTKQVLTIRSHDKNEVCSAGCGNDTKEILVSDNILVSGSDIAMSAVTRNNSSQTAHGTDLIFERNFIVQTKTPNDGMQFGLTLGSAYNVTVRNNLVNITDWQGATGIMLSYVDTSWVYNNSVYSDNNSGVTAAVDFRDSTIQSTAMNNLFYAPFSSRPAIKGTPTIASHNITASVNPFIGNTFDEPSNFNISENSIAIDSGALVPVFEDFLLNRRDINNNLDVGAFMIDIVSSLSFDDYTSDVRLYPNPSTSDISIQSEKEILTIEVFDLLGNKIQTLVSSNGQRNNVKINHLKPGQYICIITTTDGTIRQKISVIE